jgi:hypothetical protein
MTRNTQKIWPPMKGLGLATSMATTCKIRGRKKRFLVTDWLEIRVLPAPPRSRAQKGISRFSANRPELAAIRARILSLQSADWIEGSVSGSLSLPWKIAFPDGGDGLGRESVRMLG